VLFRSNYLMNGADISYLAELQFPDGSPLFGPPELSHMQDVKMVVQHFLEIWYLISAAALLLGLWAWRGRWLPAYLKGLQRGGWLTLMLALSLGILGTIGASGSGDLFWQFFERFHGLFFQGSSWLFPYSSTLIRLYPLQFWQDCVLYIGILAALGGGALALIPAMIRRGSEKSSTMAAKI